MAPEVYDSGKHSSQECPGRGTRGVQGALRGRGAHAEIRHYATPRALGAGSGAVRWVSSLWRGVSGGWRRLLCPRFGEPVSEQWLREEHYRSGTRGIDGPAWTWPLKTQTIRRPTVGGSRSSRGGSDV
jgi:hypothetical protein